MPLPEGYAAKPELGLAKVPRVESYRGFVFGSHAAEGPGLAEFLGGLASAFDNMLDRAPAGTVSRFGGALRLEYRGNWKMFMENAVDLVHPGFVHRSSVEAARAQPQALAADALTQQGAQMFLANGMRAPQWDEVPLHAFPGGHVYMGGFYKGGVIGAEREDPVFARYRAQLVERHGEEKAAAVLAVDRFNNLVWPNVSVNARFAAMRVVQPLAADRTVVEVLCFRLDGAERGRCTSSRCSSSTSPPRRPRWWPPTTSSSSSAASAACATPPATGSTCAAACSPTGARPTARCSAAAPASSRSATSSRPGCRR